MTEHYIHPDEGYRGDIIYEHANNKWQVRYELKSEKLTTQLLNKFIPAYCEKKLQDCIADLPNRCIVYKNLGDCHTLILQNPDEAIEGLNKLSTFIRELDVFLHYYLMDLSSLGNHLQIFHDVIREKHQWHWLQEEPDYDALIME